MSTTSLIAGEVMNRVASLMNDTAKTDYTFVAQIPYLNMAIDELVESLEESNSSPTNRMLFITIVVPVGKYLITPIESPITPHYPPDLIEIQEVSERTSGSNDSFIRIDRKEFLSAFPASNSFLAWSWESQIIKFNPNGALTPREIMLKYVAQAIQQVTDENTIIGTTGEVGMINARSYLSYKTAALCARFIGENETRADVLDNEAEKALERITGINNKGRQQMMTRHRPFRASYKSRGGF